MIQQKLVEVLAAVPPHHPIFFFMQLFSAHYVGELPFALPLMVLALLGVFAVRKNYFWYAGIAVCPGLGPVALVNIAVGLLSLDEVWKLPLYLYVIGDLYLRSVGAAWQFYNFLALLALLAWIYRELPFNNPNENRLYFGGFGGLWFSHFTIFISSTLDVTPDRWYFPVLLTCFAMGCSFYIIGIRMDRIFNMKLEEIESASQYLLYVRHIQLQLQEPFEQIGMERAHRQICKQTDCRCCSEPTKKVSFNQLFVREHYAWARLKFGLGRATNFLQEYLVKTLLEEGQFPLAVEEYLLMRESHSHDLFSLVQVRRLEDTILTELAKIEAVYVVRENFKSAFDYETDYEILRRDIRELVELKLTFWREVCLPFSKLTELRRMGKQLLRRFNSMHEFFCGKVRPVEEQIRLFHCSIIYNLFLLMATNYRDLAHTNIKQLQKTSDTITVDSHKDTKSFYVKVSINEKTFGNIENTTTNFIKLIRSNRTKGDFIGRCMEFFIPRCYVREHMRGMRELRRYNINNLLGVNVEPLFFVDSEGHIVPCNAVVKYSVNVLNELSVIGNVKRLNDEADYVLYDSENKIAYQSTDRIDPNLLELEEVRKALNSMRAQWIGVHQEQQNYGPVQAVKLSVKLDHFSYTCILSSPLATSFRYPNPPPIHLGIINESQNYFGEIEPSADLELGDCMKRVHQLIQLNDGESKSTGSGRQCETIDVIKKVEGATVPYIVTKFGMVLHAVVLLGLVGVVLCFVLYNGNWTGSTPEYLSYQMLGSTYKLESYIARTVSKGIVLAAISNGNITTSEYQQGYSSTNYMGDTLQQLKQVCHQLKTTVTKDMWYQDNFMSNDYFAIANERLFVQGQNVHYLSVMDFMVKAVSDCLQISNGISFVNTTLPRFYWRYIMDNCKRLIRSVRQDLDSMLRGLDTSNITLTVMLVVLVIVCIICVEIGNRAISRRENSVYELLVSTETGLINTDISALSELENSLRNDTTNMSRSLQSHTDANLFNVAEANEKTEEDSAAERRKRNGELDYTGYSRSTALLYVGLALISVVIVGQLVVKRYNIDAVRQHITQQVDGYEWRNGRLLLEVNLKKLILNFTADEQVSGNSLESWLQQSITNRKLNYVLRNSITNFTYNCSNPMFCSSTSAMSSELALSQYTETLIAELFLERHVGKLALLERIEEISSYLFEKDYSNLEQLFSDSVQIFSTLKVLLLVVGVAVSVLGIFVNVLFVRRLNREFMMSIRMLTLLNEDMVRKNKRVEGYLQRLKESSA